MNMLQQLQQRLSGQRRSPDEDMIRIRHVMMKTYGWIPIDEFCKLGINEINDLIEHILEDEKNNAKKARNMVGKR